MASEKNQYLSDYVKKNIRQFMFKASKIHDQDIVEWLESKDSVQTYLKQLIRADIEAHSTPTSVPDSSSVPE